MGRSRLRTSSGTATETSTLQVLRKKRNGALDGIGGCGAVETVALLWVDRFMIVPIFAPEGFTDRRLTMPEGL
jgi:hypothetical protein